MSPKNGLTYTVSQILIFGCGDTGQRVARRCLAQQLPVAGVVRSETSHRALLNAGIESFLIDLDAPITTSGLPSRDAKVFYMVPPPEQGDSDPRLHTVLTALEHSGLPARILYISTSGVYGDCQGRWIDETAPLAPVTPRAQRRVAAEMALREWCDAHRVSCIILRVPAIYGPGRLPLERLRSGMAALKAEECGFTNRIHIDDLARICIRAMNDAPDNTVYNVSDGNPSTFTDYLMLLAELTGLPKPPLVAMRDAEARIDAGMLGFMRESKRLRNDKLLHDLKFTLHYPDVRSGILASLEPKSGHPPAGPI